MRIVPSHIVAKLLAVAGGALLAGCASVPSAAPESSVDYARVAMIERAARAYGTQVIWINMPTKRTVATQ